MPELYLLDTKLKRSLAIGSHQLHDWAREYFYAMTEV